MAAFFTSARDAVAKTHDSDLLDSQCCCHFSVEELPSNLFSDTTVKSIFKDVASMRPSKAKRTLKEVASTAKMHSNHFIQAQERKIIAHHI
jgi:hypothetical protein